MTEIAKRAAASDAAKVPKGRTQREHRQIVWMNYSDIFDDRQQFDKFCDGYLVRKGKTETELEPESVNTFFSQGTGGGRRVIRSTKGLE